VRYDFSKSELTNGPFVRTSAGTPFNYIDSAAYFPGNLNAYAFQNGEGGKPNLVYVNLNTGTGTVVASGLEGGRITGAAAVHTALKPYKVYGIQQAKIKPPSSIQGGININPNNSPQNEFSLKKGDGNTITRDDLHQQTNVDSSGTYYQGAATFIHVKPKGNGNQNSLMVNGQVFPVQNSNTYDFQGEMQVRVWNDQIKNSKAMGHWWISIISGNVYVNGETQIESPNRLTEINPNTGVVTELVKLNDPCTGLASSDGNTFYTFRGSDLLKIEADTETVTKVTTTTLTHVTSVNVVGDYLIAHDASQNRFVPLDPTTGQPAGQPGNLGTTDLGGTFFTPLPQDPIFQAHPYD
jgi:hypothetical protein